MLKDKPTGKTGLSEQRGLAGTWGNKKETTLEPRGVKLRMVTGML